MTTPVLDEAGSAAAPPAAPTPSAQTTVTPRALWLRSRVGAGIVLMLASVSLIIAFATRGVAVGYLDPEAADPSGSRAIVELLKDRGVEVTREVQPATRAAGTVVVAAPELVDPELLADVVDDADTGDVVVVGADEGAVRRIRDETDLDLRVAGSTDVEARRPACEARFAQVAGTAHAGGVLYDAPDAGFRCYASGGDASLLVYETPGGGRVTFVGSGDFLTNKRLDDEGNAALALGLLARHDSVSWVYPRLDELGLDSEEQQSLADLLPERLLWAIVQLFLALALLAAWRARRLGPVVAEDLPVVVRAAEAAEGRARLYEGAGARDRAALVLRDATRDRLARALGLGRDATRGAVCAAVADRTAHSASEIELLLYGGPPGDDAQLVRLAATLDSLEREVRTT